MPNRLVTEPSPYLLQHAHNPVAWWQWVVFAEAGRVAPSWTFETLHKNMKFDLGVGVRGMVKGLIVRIDLAGSSESYGVSMMVSQPFQW